MLYFAYGSNLEIAAMRQRCPAAVVLGRAVLPGHRLVFRLWADVEPHPGASVAGGLWRITPDCLAALDDYEEVDSGLYRRVLDRVWRDGVDGAVEALCYRMNAADRKPPRPGYLEALARGYRDFGLDAETLHAAAHHARGVDLSG